MPIELDTPHGNVDVEYGEAHATFRHLAEIRFKLLAFLPTVGGVAVFALSFSGLKAEQAAPVNYTAGLWLVILVGALGLFASLGLVLYDQRNSELYNAVIHRAKSLERQFHSLRSPGAANRTAQWGGIFSERPPPIRRVLGIPVRHDTALALIYGAVVGAWGFPIVFAAGRLLERSLSEAATYGSSAAGILTLLMIGQLLYNDRQDLKRWHRAWSDDHPKRQAG